MGYQLLIVCEPGMVSIDICQACGDKHEASRGAKCKVVKVKLTHRAVKHESLDEDDSLGAIGGVEDVVDKMLTLSISEGRNGVESKRPSTAEVELDEEEMELLWRLEQRVLERCKAKLRVKLDRDPITDEEDRKETRSWKKKEKRKKHKCKSSKRGKGSTRYNPSSSPSSSSPSSSSSSESENQIAATTAVETAGSVVGRN